MLQAKKSKESLIGVATYKQSLGGTGLKITAGHRTMSGQDDYLSGQNLGMAVILTSHVRGFQIIN